MERNQIYTKILELKSNLDNTDYQVIKCAEHTALGQEIRDEINRLQEEYDNFPEEEEIFEEINE